MFFDPPASVREPSSIKGSTHEPQDAADTMPAIDEQALEAILDESRRRYDEEWQQRARVYSEVNTLLIIVGAIVAGLISIFPQLLGAAPTATVGPPAASNWLRVFLLAVAGLPMLAMCACLTLIFWQPRRRLGYYRPPAPDKVLEFVYIQGESYRRPHLISDLANSYAQAASYNGRENLRLINWLVWTRTFIAASTWLSLPILIVSKMVWP